MNAEQYKNSWTTKRATLKADTMNEYDKQTEFSPSFALTFEL